MTASVVLNGATSSTRVSETTRARIQEAAHRLHYRPNGVARGLSRRRMDTIGVVATVDGNELNLYFLEVLNGILQADAQHGQNTTVFSVTDWKADEAKMLQFCDGRVDGMILIGPMITPEFAQTLQRHVAFVALHSDMELPTVHAIDIDNEGGAFAMVQYLIAQGHRRILHLSANPALVGVQQRLAGYRRALAEANIAFEERLIVPGEYSMSSGRARMSDLLEQGRFEALPTAVFCANDAIAYGCMEALASHGLRVPEDISVAGFDDALLARMTTPPLTTMRQPFRRMGSRAVELLLSQGKDETTLESHGVQLFPVEIVIRQSVGPPPVQALVPPYLPAGR